jgi:hypothetical protein
MHSERRIIQRTTRSLKARWIEERIRGSEMDSESDAAMRARLCLRWFEEADDRTAPSSAPASVGC